MFVVMRTIGLILVEIVLSGCWSQDKPVESRLPLKEEQLSVYRRFLDKFSSLHFRNLAIRTVPLDFEGLPAGRPCLRGIDLENLDESFHTTHIFGPGIAKGAELRLVTPVEQEELLQRRESSTDKRNEKLGDDVHKPFSELDYLVLSEIAFDSKHRFAILKYLLVCGQHCVSGATLVMERVDGTWTVSSRRPCALFVGN